MADKIPKKGAIFILYKDSLLAKGLEAIFSEKGVPVKLADLKDASAWDKLTQDLQPGDVVIVDRRDTQVHPYLSLTQLFMKNQEISIIGLDSGEDHLELYQRQMRIVKEPEELVRFIDSCWTKAQAVLGNGEYEAV